MVMKKKHVGFIVFILAMGFAFACDDPEEPLGIGVHDGDPVSLTAYPFANGRTWVYQVNVTITGDITSSSEYLVKVSAIADSVINGTLVTKLRSWQIEEADTFIGTEWLANLDSGLFGIAYDGMFASVGDKASVTDFPLDNLEIPDFTGIGKTDSVTLAAVPPCFLRFPASVGQIWSFSQSMAEIGVFRAWVGYNLVITETGHYDCVRMVDFRDADSDGIPDDDWGIEAKYYSPTHGLVMAIMDNELVFGSGQTGHFHREARLIEVNF
jgi:hypothetical protein